MDEEVQAEGELREAHTDSQTGSQSGIGQAQMDISNGIVHAHKDCYGKGPTKARTHVFGDHVLCVLEGGFHAAERTLNASGRADVVESQRAALQDIIEDRFVSIVQDVLGRRVRSFMSASDPENELQAEVFVLEPAAAEEGLMREAEQARRRNREILDEHRALRAEQQQARRRRGTPPPRSIGVAACSDAAPAGLSPAYAFPFVSGPPSPSR